ncbi:hypothetical protein ACIQPP_50610 [Streptomyces violaceusniger]|uniref:hypothetical protein n=1 Tax=Streptomyces violaceusniger TaxID=68280 RepID=UPI0009972387|nr:hypothetical protein [Streptomyces hygroscopicus]AQW48286.1 hypothetical protein SHXM_01749 [Streptomyces hygroscopicus]
MSEPTDYWLTRPLPRPVTPFPRESERSYLERMGAANGIQAQKVLAQSSWLESQQDYAERLAIVSGQPRETLLNAIPQLRQGSWPLLSDRPDFSVNIPCRLCVARRTGSYSYFSTVSAWSSRFHDQVCLRHKIWTGRSVENYMQQVDVTDLPDVIQAQRRHYRLLRRHGHVVLSACFEHCSDRWDAVVRRGYRPSDRRRRLDILGTSHPQIWDARRYIAVYPEVVAATALYASPHWRKLARSDDSGYFQFRIEFIRQLPQERFLRKSSKPWFLKELRDTALRIEAAISHRLEPGDAESGLI